MEFRIIESYIDSQRESLSPYVWTNRELNSDIREDILSLISNVHNILDIYISGSITTEYWVDDTDVDITVFVKPGSDMEIYRDISRKLNGSYVIGKHPVNFFFRDDNIGETFTDGLYSLIKDEWIKEPTQINDLFNYLDEPYKLAKNISNKLDIDLLEIEESIYSIIDVITDNKRWRWNLASVNNDISDFNLRGVNKEIIKLENEIEEYISDFSVIKNKRLDAFSRALDGGDLDIVNKYKTRNLLPDALIYKYITKWLYSSWYNLFMDVMKDGIIEVGEINVIWKKFINFFE